MVYNAQLRIIQKWIILLSENSLKFYFCVISTPLNFPDKKKALLRILLMIGHAHKVLPYPSKTISEDVVDERIPQVDW